jgi:FkbM family methyltransferase
MSYKLSPTCQIKDLDKIYYKYFGEISTGYFIEVGAFDGESVSNTSCLADCGWKGVYIEPVLEHYIQCNNRHICNDVIVANLSIGLDEGEQEIYCSGIVSTLDKTQSETISKMDIFNYPSFTKSKCYQMRFDTFLRKYQVPQNFDLLVIDVEGREEQIFASFDLEEWKPKMLIVELVDEHLEFQNKFRESVEQSKKLRSYINSKNYCEIYKDHINTVFILNDYITSNTNI